MNRLLRLLGLCRHRNVVHAMVYLMDVQRQFDHIGDRHFVNASLMTKGLPRQPHPVEDRVL